MSDTLGLLIKGVERGDARSLARLMTLLEEKGSIVLREKKLLNPKRKALRIGITGPPGAGKSTLIGALIHEYRKRGQNVGVLAVDPSSPFTKGAILGDRIRYHAHSTDKGVFVRSIGSRGSLGGLSASAYLMARAFDVYGCDVVLIETVGVGQTEMEIMNVADLTAVVIVPEFGDSIQAMKAGLLEIADIFVVNKADRPGADVIRKELEEWTEGVPILTTIATQEKGISQFIDAINVLMKTKNIETHRTSLSRLQAEARALLRSQYDKKLEKRIEKIRTSSDLSRL